jgi:hypothetical protein
MSVNVVASEAATSESISLRRRLARLRIKLLCRNIGRAFILPAALFATTVAGFLVMGYHPGTEDDGVYLTAVKANLNPLLFPHDSDFFKLELKTTVFDTWMAAFVREIGIPVAWAELLWQFLSLFSIVSSLKKLPPDGLEWPCSWLCLRFLWPEPRSILRINTCIRAALQRH